jgi:hypothetical protein
MPFRATLDGRDRIAALDLTPPDKAGGWSIKLEAYGEVQAQPAPAPSEIRKPSARVLEVLGGAG